MDFIFGALIQLAIVIAIVVLIVRLVTKRQGATGDGAGVFLRRFFQYTSMLGMLALAGIGLAGLIDAAAGAATRVTQDTTTVARSIAFVVVGVPVYIFLALHTARRLRDDPRERQSSGWAFYLTVALFGSLVAAMSLTAAFLGSLLDERSIDRSLLISAVIWTGVWAGHWWVAQRKGFLERKTAPVLLGSAAGLVAVATGAGVLSAAVLQQIYDRLFDVPVVGAGVEAMVRPLIILGVGVPVWWWHWFRHAGRGTRNPSWFAYVLLLGILGGVVAVVSGTGFTLFAVLQWVLGDPSSNSPAAHFGFLPDALGAMAVGTAGWAYHRSVLGDRAERERNEVDRVYDYLLSGSGLLVGAAGLVALVTVALDALGAREIASSESGDAVASALTLLVIGVPLWWRYWSSIRRHRAANPEVELGSVTRRIYLFFLFGATGILAVINLVIIVFILFEDILEGTFGRATISSAAVPIALLIAAGAVAWYHFAVFREDRSAAPDEAERALREVILVSADGEQLAEAIKARTGATVRPLRALARPSAVASFGDVLEALGTEKHQRVLVVSGEDDGYKLVPVEG